MCDRSLVNRLNEINEWLRAGIRNGRIGYPLEEGFPRYVWHMVGDEVFEARLLNRSQGQYKGYKLEREEWPEAFE